MEAAIPYQARVITRVTMAGPVGTLASLASFGCTDIGPDMLIKVAGGVYSFGFLARRRKRAPLCLAYCSVSENNHDRDQTRERVVEMAGRAPVDAS